MTSIFGMLLGLFMILLGFGASSTPAPPEPWPAGDVHELVVDQTIEIPIGDTNQSTRYHWSVVNEPDTSVVRFEIIVGEAPAGCEPGGCYQPTTLAVTGVAPGTTELTVNGCHRLSDDTCDTLASDTSTYTVTVS